MTTSSHSAMTTGSTGGRLIVYVATDAAHVVARAGQLAAQGLEWLRVVVVGNISPDREQSREGGALFCAVAPQGVAAQTPTLGTLALLSSLDDHFRPDGDDIVCRIDFRSAGLELTDRMMLTRFAGEVLQRDYLDGIRTTLATMPTVGLATPTGLPRISIGKADDDSLVPRLAQALSIPQQHFAETCFFPHPICFVRASVLRTLTSRYAVTTRLGDIALEQALSLGFHALCNALGQKAIDVTPNLHLADPAALWKHMERALEQPGTSARDPQWQPRAPKAQRPAEAALKYIAYYLPQFHAIPENDRWWGAGFTEWTNVTKAVPRFVGHYQPHLPADLGFYDLSHPEAMAKQVELARQYGIHGFCFYFYWFNGTTLLEQPLRNYLDHPEMDLPFCLCWANENWTRRWDGQEAEVLMAQSHSPRDDLGFIKHIADYLRDPRYIRIDGRPLLLVYRASLLDDARATAERWREYCRANGIGELYLAAVCSFDIDDPRPFGFDIAVEFPPHQLRNMPPINTSLEFLDRNFSGEVLDYRETVLLTALEKYAADRQKPFPTLHGVMTGWDNEARRPGRGRTFHHAGPAAYANWLRLASNCTRRHNPPELQYVFINAWNEWAEGAHLEPDRRFGHGYLAATADTLKTFSAPEERIPTGLGSASAAASHAPAPLIRIRDEIDIQFMRERIEALGGAPSIHVVIWGERLDPGLLDTLQTVAEQGVPLAKLTLYCADPVPVDWSPCPNVAQHSPTTPAEDVLACARGSEAEWLVVLYSGDRLLPHSLLAVATSITADPKILVVGCDELIQDGEEERSRPLIRPMPGREALLAAADTPVPLAYRCSLLRAAGPAIVPAAPLALELTLRAMECGGIEAIGYLQEILVWRNSRSDPDRRRPLEQRILSCADVVRTHLARDRRAATVDIVETQDALRIDYQPDSRPLVSIIIPTFDQTEALQRCIESIFASTSYPNFELIVVDNGSPDPVARAFLDGLPLVDPARIRVVAAHRDFSFAALCNLGRRSANGMLLLFLNDDVAVLHPDWLDVMVAYALQPEAGIVGPRLLFPDGRVQHAGVVLGLSGAADMPWTGVGLDQPGWNGNLRHTREAAAVSGACMLLRADMFDRLGGMDEEFDIAYADFDLCQKVRRAGLSILWTPHATLMHEAGRTLRSRFSGSGMEAVAQGRFAAARARFLSRWHEAVGRDPYFHPALALSSRTPTLESHPALAPDPIDWETGPRVLALPADDHGSGHYRVRQPAAAAHASGLVRSRIATGYPSIPNIARLDVDTLFVQRQVDDAQLDALSQLHSAMSLRIVQDFDDLLTEVPSYSAHAGTVWKDIEQRIRRSCSLADTVTVSTEPLAEAFRRWHGDVRCIPNAIDPALWNVASTPGAREGRLRVGWAGGLSHAGDLAVVRDVVAALADKVEWIFLGMCLDDIRPKLTEFHLGVPFADYPAKLAALKLDLAIAPLASNHFNECKSNLRLLEYGALGIPVVASDIASYQCGLPITLVKNTSAAWRRAIEERIDERDALRRAGTTLREAVFADWTLEHQLPRWVDVWSPR